MEKADIGYLIKQISDAMKANGDRDLSEYDLTFSQMRVIHILNRNKGRLPQKTIEQILDVAHPTVVGLVSRLEEKGFVSTETDPEDRRYKIVCMTEKAEALRQTLEKKKSRQQGKMLAGFSDEEKKQLICLLEKVYANMEERSER